jgi:LuxR family maltose regulon positive regulatory protein
LLELLDQARTRKLTLISAPPGFGKTSLLVEWHALHPSFGLGWLALDEADNEPLRFWNYFVAAVQRVCPEVGKAALASLQNSATTPPPIEAVLTELINELSALPVENVCGLVLDDYHVINNPAIHQGLTFLLDHLPSQLRLFITSRADPMALPLSRLRVRGELAEIRAAQLRFTLEEVVTFFKTRAGANLSAQDIERLAARTEGWVAGLQLAALSLQDYSPDEAHRFVESFAGNDRYIVDYLLEEVLQRQPPSLQAFLMETSLLDRLSAPLCQAVTGQEATDATLTQLEKNNLFVISLDNRREWYRYHHLFAELLRHHLSQTCTPAHVNELNLRASGWFEQNGQALEAVQYALAAQAFDRAADLIEPLAEELTVQAQFLTLKKWYSLFPAGLWQTRPYLAMSYAWVLMLTGQPGEAEVYIKLAQQSLETEAGQRSFRPANLPGHLLILQTHLASQRGEIARTLELGEKAFRMILADTAGGVSGGSSLALVLARTHLENNDRPGAEQNFQKAVELGQRAGNLYTAISGMVGLADLQMFGGDLRQSEQLLRQAIEMGTPANPTAAGGKAVRPLPAASEAFSHLSEILIEWNRLEEAEQQLTWGTELAPYLQNSRMLLYNALMLARLQAAQGKYAEALTSFEAADKLAEQLGQPAFKGPVAAYRTRVWLKQDRLTEAAQWALTVPTTRTTNPASRKFWPERTTLARVWLATGETERAQQLLDELQKQAQGWRYGELEVQLLEALLWQKSGDRTRAIQTLSTVLVQAEPQGFTRLIIEEGPPLAALLQQLANSKDGNVPKHYIGTLLKVPGTNAPAEEPAQVGKESSLSSRLAIHDSQLPPLVSKAGSSYEQVLERPSERELEVLRLIAAGLSNQEIAEQLVVSPNTIKAHINKLYSKLDVNSRTQAILRAQELNLL